MKPHRLLIIAAAISALALCGCNRVSVEDCTGTSDQIRLPAGYRFAGPMHIEQTQTNITVTVIFERIEP